VPDDANKAELLARYNAALERFNAATAILLDRNRTGTPPTAAELDAEKDARDELLRVRVLRRRI
jgi:hypothetical protein